MDKMGLIQKARKGIEQNAPTILTGLGVAGVLSTAALAVRATPEAMRIIAREEQEELLSKKEIVKATWRVYIPAVIMGGVTATCIVSANTVNLKRNAALASVYSITDKTLRDYQSKVIETLGEKEHIKIKDELAKDELKANPLGDRELTMEEEGMTICYEALSGRYFKSDIEAVRAAISNLNRDLLSDSYMFVTLNDAYYQLGLSTTTLGDQMGWHIDDGVIEPYFSSQLTEDGKPCLVISFNIQPRYIGDRN